MLHTILGALGAVAFLATCIAAERIRMKLQASGLPYRGGHFIGD
jgi:hypothetical protein